MSNRVDQWLTEYKEARQRGEKPLFIFDIDSTLFHVHHRNRAVLEAFLQIPEIEKRYPGYPERFAGLQFQPSDWGYHEPLKRAGLRQEDGTFLSDLKTFWDEKFFSGEYLNADEPVAGALAFLKRLETENARFVYLTGRDAPRMRTGTLHRFNTLGLPLLDEEHLMMKPDRTRADVEFKREALKRLTADHSPTWFFENEPLILWMAQENFPQMKLYFLETTHSGVREAPETAVRIRNFLD